jgi:hypothetical protein
MADVLLGVGPYRFKIKALNYQALTRTFNYRWVSQERIGRRPAMQFLGPGEETVELRGVIYPKDPRFGGGFSQLENMRKEAMRGRPRGVASSLGRYHGRWCIKEVSDVQTYFAKNGAPRKVEFTIKLTAYGADGGGILSRLF